jgi:DNA-binding NarL/FixJ family response regulator
MAIRVLIYDDNTDLRHSLSMLVSGLGDFTLVGAFPDCGNIEDEIIKFYPDVVLMDIDMPNVNGIEGLKILKKISPDTQVIMLTIFEDNEHIFEAICEGASGYILKRTPPSKILDAITDVYQGGAPMTASIAKKVLQLFSDQHKKPIEKEYDLNDREKEVLHLLSKGMSYKLIAVQLHLSVDAIRSRIKKIYDKLHVHTMSEAVAVAIKKQLLD